MSDLYNVIAALCEDKGITAYRMCKDLNMRPSVMSDLKSGRKHNLRADTANKVASYFGVSVDYLLGNEQKDNTPAASSDRDVDRFMELFTKLTPEQQERELAYLQQLVDAQGK